MLEQFNSLPHPTWTELIISAQILMVLWPLRLLQRALENELQKDIRRIRTHHRRNHDSHARWCKEGECSILSEGQTAPQSPLEQAALLASVRLEEEHPASDHHLTEVSP